MSSSRLHSPAAVLNRLSALRGRRDPLALFGYPQFD